MTAKERQQSAVKMLSRTCRRLASNGCSSLAGHCERACISAELT